MVKKYAALFKSLDSLVHMTDKEAIQYYKPLMAEYLRYLSCSRLELDELEMEEKRYDIGRMYA
jgi:hypothetical protein